MVQLPEATSLKKTDFPSLGSHWLTVAPLLGEEPLPSWCCSVAWIFFCRQVRLPGLEPLSSTLLQPEDTVSLQRFGTSALWFSPSFWSPIYDGPSALRGGSVTWMSLLWLSTPQTRILCTLTSCGFLHQPPSTAQSDFSDEIRVLLQPTI